MIYLVTCRLCQKSYIGRTVQPLSDRLSGHRACFYKVLRNHNDVDINSDDFSLGLHMTMIVLTKRTQSPVQSTDTGEL